jgi:hypothetical protein
MLHIYLYWTIWIELYYFLFCSIFLFSLCCVAIYTVYTATDFEYIKCIINCDTARYSYSPHVLLLHILYIDLHTFKFIDCILNWNTVTYFFSVSSENFSIYIKFPHSIPMHNINYSLLCRTNEHSLVLHSYNVHLSACDWVLCSVYRMCCVCSVAVGVKQWNV